MERFKMSNIIRQLIKNKQDFWITSDTHFNHSKIIKYTNRPFKNVVEMNNRLIENWNSVVGKYDVILHLGDFGFGKQDQLQPIIDQLNGYLILLMGNHDKRNKAKFWIPLVDEVIRDAFQVENILFSHWYDLECDPDIINIHGHLHGLYNPSIDKSNHIDLSTECTNYTPISFQKDLDIVRYI